MLRLGLLGLGLEDSNWGRPVVVTDLVGPIY